MERLLPTIDIKGTDFLVDVLHEELRQKGNPANRISFNAFYQEGDGYTFLYDNELKNTPSDPSVIELSPERYEWVTLPALMELDPEGIALKYGIPIDILCAGKPPPVISLEDEDDFENDDPFI